MRIRSWTLIPMVLLSACELFEDDPGTGETADTHQAPPDTTWPTTSAPPTGSVACGQVSTPCACVPGYGAQFFPGQRVTMDACAQGVAELTTCASSCGAFLQSASVCMCDGLDATPKDAAGAACTSLTPRTWQGQAPCQPLNDYERFLLNRLATVWHTAPSVVCSYDSRQGASGPCGPLRYGAFFCGADDSIQWDALFMNQQVERHGDFAAVAVMAHEWGHLNQFRLGLLNGPSTKAHELMADCHAGVFAAVEERSGLLEAGDSCEAFRSLCEAGDPTVTDWFEPGAHGTCQERMAAFEHGYFGARDHYPDLCGPNPVGAMVALCGF